MCCVKAHFWILFQIFKPVIHIQSEPPNFHTVKWTGENWFQRLMQSQIVCQVLGAGWPLLPHICAQSDFFIQAGFITAIKVRYYSQIKIWKQKFEIRHHILINHGQFEQCALSFWQIYFTLVLCTEKNCWCERSSTMYIVARCFSQDGPHMQSGWRSGLLFQNQFEKSWRSNRCCNLQWEGIMPTQLQITSPYREIEVFFSRFLAGFSRRKSLWV